ncbi:MAG TPA: hypothetical protein VMS22_15780, partial [Candidatus Eisenbacteria bacterium]|nr:hypothetical protein [Candidatus Eisenbacteria bacterium]
MYYGSPNTGVLGHSLTTCSGTFGSDDVPQVTLNCTLDQTGVYVLQLRDQNDGATPAIDPTETGGYTLALTCLDGPCTTATTTSTTTLPGGATTTSTTLPVTTEELVDGAHLVLKANGSKPQKAKLTVVLRDPDITVAATNGSADDPRTAGATLRVVAGGGDGFDDTYDIAAAHWTLVGPSGRNKGYRYVAKSGAPVRLALVKPKLVRINASGAGLMDTLATNPNPVHVVLTMGGVRYCASFGGSVTFKAGRSYDAKSAPAPGTCP